MDKKTTHNNLAEKLIESESRFRVQYQNNPIPTFTWRYIGDTFILEDYNVAASALTKGDIVKYLNKTAWEMYQNRPDILADMNRCYEEKNVVRRKLRSESFQRPRMMNVTWSYAPPDMIIAYLEDITEIMHTEEVLKESVKQFRAIADFTPDWENWVGPDGKLLWVNPSVFEFIGYTVEECMTMSNYPVAIFDEADQKRMGRLFIEAVQGSSGNNVECRVVCKDGRKKWITVSWQPICDEDGCRLGHRASIHDITERKLMEDQLYNTNERLEAMLSALPDLMFRIDQDGCIHECHFSSIDRLYVPPSAFMGKKIADVIPEETTRIIMTALGEAATRGSHHGATYSLTVPKGLSWYELSIAMMGEKKQSDNQFIVLIRDITDRKQLEEDLKKAYDELEARVLERTAELA
ncbi:MAG: PAS domain-containing protein, partial [Smithella sp.]